MITNTNNSAEKNVLEKIVDDKRIEIAALKVSKPLTSFINELVPTSKDI